MSAAVIIVDPAINPMQSIPLKRTTPLDLHKPLALYIAHHFSSQAAQNAEPDLQAIQRLRADIDKPAHLPEARRDALLAYFKALSVVELLLPISGERGALNSVYFTWFDAFKTSKRATQQSIPLEKAAVAFNYGAVHSQVALTADRSTPGGLKQACNAFQLAAGVFSFVKNNISVGSSTVDISPACAGMLENLMLAQAQECFYEKALADSKPSSICAKVARQVGLYYEEACVALAVSPLSQHFDRAWIAHVQLKAALFHAEACYRAALDLHHKENIAEEIARLKVAAGVLIEAKKSAVRGVAASLLDMVSKLEAEVNANLDIAIKENERVYLMRIPSIESLPSLAAASLVKPGAVGDLFDASKEELFKGLVPDSSSLPPAERTYTQKEVISAQAQNLHQESESTAAQLSEANLPNPAVSPEESISLPDHLKDDLEAVRKDGGLAGFEARIIQLKDLRCVNESLLAQTVEILANEAKEDALARSIFGARWVRPESTTLTKSVQARASSYAANLKQAGECDEQIERTIRNNSSLMSILDSWQVETNALMRKSKSQDSFASPEGLFKQIEAAILKYKQIQENINEGIKFYATLQDAISNLKQQCGDFTMTRNIQSREMMDILQQKVTRMPFNQ